jgi:hypothetical protein
MSVRRQRNGKMVDYEDNQPCNFSDEVEEPKKHESQKLEEKQEENVKTELPPKFYMNSDLKKILPDYSNRRKIIKNKKQIDFWEVEIDNLLTLYDSKSDKYHFSLCRAVLQILEDYCIWDVKLGETKKHIASNILLKFFDNNLDLVNAIIENELPHIVHSSLLRRLFCRLEILFFSKKL